MFLVPPHVRIVAERSVELGEESVEIGKKMLGKQDETIDAIEGIFCPNGDFLFCIGGFIYA